MSSPASLCVWSWISFSSFISARRSNSYHHFCSHLLYEYANGMHIVAKLPFLATSASVENFFPKSMVLCCNNTVQKNFWKFVPVFAKKQKRSRTSMKLKIDVESDQVQFIECLLNTNQLFAIIQKRVSYKIQSEC